MFEHPFAEWYDWWRLAVLLVSIAVLVILIHQFRVNRGIWGERQRDRWFMLIMWSVAAGEMQVEGILRDTELRFRLVFVSIAIILTLKLITKKRWQDDKPKV